MFHVEFSGCCSHRIQPPWWCLYTDSNCWSLTQMSPELSTSCQAHTESLTLIPCSLRHHTEHPKWLKLVGSNPTSGSPPGKVTQSSHQLAKKKEPCHTDGPSSKNSSDCPLAITQNMPGHQLEGANHSKLKQLQFWLSQSVSNHNSSSLVVVFSQSCHCNCFYITQIWSCSYSFCLLLQTHPLTTQH